MGILNDRDRVIQEEQLRELFNSGIGQEIAYRDSDRIDPWKRSIYPILWGLALTLVTLNFWYLDIILPAVGVALMYVGLRSLRRENGQLRWAWIISIIRIITFCASCCIEVSPLMAQAARYRVNEVSWVVGLAFSILILVQLILIRSGIRRIFREHDVESHRDPLLWVIIWYILILVMAVLRIEFLGVLGLAAILLMLCILIPLGRVPGEFRDNGFLLKPAPVRVLGIVIVPAYLILTLILVYSMNFFTVHYLPGTENYEEPAMSELRQKILELGMPEEILRDIPDEDLEMNGKPVEVDWVFSSFYQTRYDIIDSEYEKLAVYYYCWDELPNSGEVVYAKPWYSFMDLRGSLLYERDGETYIAPIPDLAYHNVGDYVAGSVRFPPGAENMRGYVILQGGC